MQPWSARMPCNFLPCLRWPSVHLCRFCAVCLERPFVVMEFYRHGSVFDMMRKAYVELNAYQDAAEQQLVSKLQGVVGVVQCSAV